MKGMSTLHGGGDFSATLEAPEVPDEDGLTDSEFRIVSEQARDGRLSRKDRADAAMLMIFGTRRKCLRGCGFSNR